jgi:hypothetical protein
MHILIFILSTLVSHVYFGTQQNYPLLLETLSNKLRAEGLMLTVGVIGNADIAEEAYDFKQVAQ